MKLEAKYSVSIKDAKMKNEKPKKSKEKNASVVSALTSKLLPIIYGISDQVFQTSALIPAYEPIDFGIWKLLDQHWCKFFTVL